MELEIPKSAKDTQIGFILRFPLADRKVSQVGDGCIEFPAFLLHMLPRIAGPNYELVLLCFLVCLGERLDLYQRNTFEGELKYVCFKSTLSR